MYEVPTQEKITQATHIFEGEVVAAESFWAEDSSMIYTAYRVAVFKVFKGQVYDSSIQVIAQGGRVGRDLIRLTSNLEMGVGNMGIFLCRPVADFPAGPSNWGDSFEVYAGKQGFIQYDPQTLVGTDVFHIYPTPTRLYKELGGIFVQVQESFSDLLQAINPYQAAVALTTVSEDTIFYSFQNVALSGTSTYTLEADIAVAANETFELERGEVYISYNTAAFGSNMVGSGNLTVSKGLVLNGNAYTLVVSDAAPDLVHIECFYSGSSGRSDINEVPQQLVHVSVDVTNLLMNPEIEFEAPDMQGESEYFDGSTSQLFDVVEVSDGIPTLTATAVITDVSPNSTMAGDRDNPDNLIFISGSGFGNLGPNDPNSSAKVTFQNAEFDGSPSTGFSIDAVTCDVVFWTDDLIKVHVPSRNQSGPDIDSDSRTAGSGVLLVTAEDGSQANASLTVRYALANFYDLDFFGSQCFPVPHLLTNSDFTSGGYVFRYGDGVFHQLTGQTFFGSSNAQAAFERALTTWRCNTGVNFNVDRVLPGIGISDPNDNVNLATFQPLPTGLVNQAITRQEVDAFSCSGSINKAPVVDIDLAFDDDFNWYFGTGTPAAQQADFESICLHELGHAMGLEHTNSGQFPFKDVMYPVVQGGFNSVDRDLSQNDIEGGLRVAELGQLGDPNCSPPPMQLIPLNECDITNSISSTPPRLEIEAYPNPFTRDLTIVVILSLASQISVIIQDELSRQVYHESIPLHPAGTHNLTLKESFQDLSRGVYFLHLRAESGIGVFKLIKE
jgi:hypothetical protein